MSVRGFSPSLLKIYRLGSHKEFIFNCETEKAAMNLRHRLHVLRRELRKEKHWLVPVADGVIISVKGTLLIASPPDSRIENKIEEELKKQGYREDKP